MKITDPIKFDENVELNRRESCAWIDALLLGKWFNRCPRAACRCRLADSRADRFDWPYRRVPPLRASKIIKRGNQHG